MIDYKFLEDDAYDIFDELVETLLYVEDLDEVKQWVLELVVRLIDEDKIILTDAELELFQILEMVLSDISYGESELDKTSEVQLQQFFFEIGCPIFNYLLKEYDFLDFIEDSELEKEEEKKIKKTIKDFKKLYK